MKVRVLNQFASRSWQQAAACLLVLACLGSSAPVSAFSRLKPPVELSAVPDESKLELRLNRGDVAGVALHRRVLRNGKAIASLVIPARFEPRHTRSIEVPLHFPELSSYGDGIYSQIVVADAVVPGAKNDRIRVQKIVHFRLSGGVYERLSLSQYDTLIHPADWALDSTGSPITVVAGLAEATDMPAADPVEELAHPVSEPDRCDDQDRNLSDANTHSSDATSEATER